MEGGGYTNSGWAILGLSLLLIYLALTADTTAVLNTLNLGLLQDQMMLLHLGIGGSISAVLLIGFGGIIRRLGRLEASAKIGAVPDQNTAPETDRARHQRTIALRTAIATALVVAVVIAWDQGII